MATRTVRLDDEAEEALTLITQHTGLSADPKLFINLISHSCNRMPPLACYGFETSHPPHPRLIRA